MTAHRPMVAEERSALVDRVLVTTFLDHVPDYVYFKDRTGRFIAVSQSLVRHFGATTRGQVIGRTDSDFFAPTHAQPAHEDEQRIMTTGQPVIGRVERETWADGRVTWVLSSKLPLRDGGKIIGTFGISKDITRIREMELALEKAHKDVVDASRIAGMAEVATGVLHNVGNVLNSVHVSASVIATGLRQSRAESIGQLSALIHKHRADLGHFLTHDPKGKRVPEFLTSLARHTSEERTRLMQEVASLQKNIDSIKEIVSMQQAYATTAGVIEPLDPVQVMEDALRMNASALERHAVKVARDFQFTPAILGEKAKVLQILINLIRNAKYACDEGATPEKTITLRLRSATTDRVQLIVADNGVGISPENLTRIFRHGFTTRKDGHGYALHSAANAAREMKGSLTAHSAGLGFGATFTLELPVVPPCVIE